MKRLVQPHFKNFAKNYTSPIPTLFENLKSRFSKDQIKSSFKPYSEEEYQREKKDRTAFGGKINFYSLIGLYLTGIMMYSLRDKNLLNFMVQDMINDYEDVTPEQIDQNFRKIALLSSNEYNWSILKPHLDAIIYLFKFDDKSAHKADALLFLTNMMNIKECREKIYKELPFDLCLNILRDQDVDKVLGDRVSSFIFYYLKHLPKEDKEIYTPRIIDIGLSENSNIRKWISYSYPVCAMTPDFKDYLEKLNSISGVESEVSMNVKTALGKFFNPSSWFKTFNSPNAVSLYMFTIGTFWGSVIIKTFGFKKFSSMTLKNAYLRASIASLFGFGILIPSWMIQQSFNSIEKVVFAKYDYENLVPLWMFLKYSIMMAYLAFALTKTSNLHLGYFLGSFFNFDNLLVHKLGIGYVKKDRLK